jgi:hypothetical protein
MSRNGVAVSDNQVYETKECILPVGRVPMLLLIYHVKEYILLVGYQV